MGRNKDQKINRKNAAGIARNRQLAQQANGPAPEGGDVKFKLVGLFIACPKCGAAVDEACKTPSGAEAKKAHAARLK